ncbi:hydroxyacid dehydrogenase [Bifidobacterium jacchi]|uniref:Hydroxyacid dehydrogenase n=2 Tax=Bifidobacterium jacchi TaxID=2490545 RepID=A0A5N5RDS9_9BIFI|nr:hydroxyacid dehydrogenase [Bifidobacterium jacchi]
MMRRYSVIMIDTSVASGDERRPLIVVTAPVDRALLDQAFPRIVYRNHGTQGGDLRSSEASDVLASADAAVVELDRVGEADLDAAPNLKLLVVCRANPVNVDMAACAKRDVRVATTPGRNADSTADVTMGLMLEALRRLPSAEHWMASEPWRESDVFEPYRRFRGRTLSCCTVGVVGYGHVGRAVVRRLLGFGARVLVWSRHNHEAELPAGVAQVALDELLATSDVVTLHLPATPQTIGMIGARELGLMRPDALLVNTARASLLDEAAIVEALRSRRIAGAAFDVFFKEPLPADHPLRALAAASAADPTAPTVVLTPHIGGASDDVITVQTRMAIAALRHLTV